MVKPSLRARTLRRVYVKTPGGRTVIHYKRRIPQKAHCATCGAILPGVASKNPTEQRKLAKTERRPERPYGGMLCSSCMRAKIKSKFRTAN